MKVELLPKPAYTNDCLSEKLSWGNRKNVLKGNKLAVFDPYDKL
jgi:hypothetical protein